MKNGEKQVSRQIECLIDGISPLEFPLNAHQILFLPTFFPNLFMFMICSVMIINFMKSAYV